MEAVVAGRRKAKRGGTYTFANIPVRSLAFVLCLALVFESLFSSIAISALIPCSSLIRVIMVNWFPGCTCLYFVYEIYIDVNRLRESSLLAMFLLT